MQYQGCEGNGRCIYSNLSLDSQLHCRNNTRNGSHDLQHAYRNEPNQYIALLLPTILLDTSKQKASTDMPYGQKNALKDDISSQKCGDRSFTHKFT